MAKKKRKRICLRCKHPQPFDPQYPRRGICETCLDRIKPALSESRCRACNHPIVFVKVFSQAHQKVSLMPFETDTWEPHWANCPQAQRFRHKK